MSEEKKVEKKEEKKVSELDAPQKKMTDVYLVHSSAEAVTFKELKDFQKYHKVALKKFKVFKDNSAHLVKLIPHMKVFLTALQACSQNLSVDRVAKNLKKGYLDFLPHLDTYIKAQKDAGKNLKDGIKKNAKLAKELEKVRKSLKKKKLRVTTAVGFMNVPLQRLIRHELFVEEMIGAMGSNEEEVKMMKEVLEKVKEVKKNV